MMRRLGLFVAVWGGGCTPAPVPRLVVVGGGVAGLSAAIELAPAGPVVVLDGADSVGGVARWAAAVTVVPEAPSHFHAPLSARGVDWLTGLGVAFSPTRTPAPAGWRSVQPHGGGPAVVSALKARAETLGVQLRTGCRVEGLARGSAWTVETNVCGDFVADRVVLATGSVLGSDTARTAYFDGIPTLRLSPGLADGSGLQLGLDAGASLYGEGEALWFGHVTPHPEDAQTGRTLAAPPTVVALDGAGKVVPDALQGFGPARGTAKWALVTARDRARTQLFDVDRAQPVSLQAHLSAGGGRSAPTLDALADALQLPVDALTAALMPRARRRGAQPPPGPYAALPLERAPAKQLGGLATDAAGRVLDATGQPIGGLYAAGEVTGFGGLHHQRTPIDSTMVVGAVVDGRRAGEGARSDEAQ